MLAVAYRSGAAAVSRWIVPRTCHAEHPSIDVVVERCIEIPHCPCPHL